MAKNVLACRKPDMRSISTTRDRKCLEILASKSRVFPQLVQDEAPWMHMLSPLDLQE